MARLGANVTGVDPAEDSIAMAKEHCSHDLSLSASGGSLEYKCCTVEDIASGPHRFDLVVASEVVEHINQLDDFMDHLCTAVKVCSSDKQCTRTLLFSYSLEAM